MTRPSGAGGAVVQDLRAPGPTPTAERCGLVGCRTCGRVWPQQTARCARCGARLRRPELRSLATVWAWLVTGMIFYIPANLAPMLRTDLFLMGSEQSTILGGIVVFLQHGDWFVATVIFAASIVVPVGKFLAIGYLALTVRRGLAGGATGHRKQGLYEVVDFIGRWSMVDVFVVAVLSALVQLGFVVSIHPGPAAAAFALSVAFTMLAAQSFDSRLVWRLPSEGAAPAAAAPAGDFRGRGHDKDSETA